MAYVRGVRLAALAGGSVGGCPTRAAVACSSRPRGSTVIPQVRQEGRAVTLQLHLPHAVDAQQALVRLGVVRGHLDQRAVGEDDVGRHPGVVGECLAPGPQQLEQVLVVVNRADRPGRAGSPLGRGLQGSLDRFALGEDLPAFGRQPQVAVAPLFRQQALADQLAGEVLPARDGQLLPDAIGGQLVVAVAEDLLLLGAEQHGRHVLGGVPLPGAHDAGHQFLSRDGDVHLRQIVAQADVAHAAVLGRVLLPEVGQERDAAAGGALGVAGEGLEVLLGDLALVPLSSR